MSDVRCSLIVAMGENHVIGSDGGMPWRLRDDLKHFMRTTRGHSVIMGRSTFETLNGPLSDRTNIVLTRNTSYSADGVLVAHDLSSAMAMAREAPGSDEVFIAGGGDVYRQSMSLADRMYVTLVHGRPAGDTTFPSFVLGDWDRVSMSEQSADDRNSHAFTIMVLDRRKK